MRLFGGQVSTSIRVDLSVPVPHYSLRTTLSNISIEEFLKALSSKKVGQGSIDFSASLSMQGSSMAEIKQSVLGQFFLHGEHLTFYNANEELGNRLGVESLTMNVHNLRIAGGNDAELLKNISFTSELVCRDIKTMGFIVSDMRFTCNGKDGIYAFNPVTMHLSGGQGLGSIRIDLTDPVPRYSVRASLSEFRIEDYLKVLSSKKVGQGSMNFSANLSMRGNSAAEIKQSAQGEVTLQGENLTLYGYNLDLEFARFESSQNFNLVDAGAFFFAGPLGLAVTKGYTFASIFKGSGGSTGIGRLFSRWKVEHGIAQAKDVAMSTRQNRIALKGRINFVNEHFYDVTIALVDARGCARVKQKIHGPFRKPVVEKPSFLMSIAGPALNLFNEASDLFTGGKCDVFYIGSVPAPK
jgi:AsmA protein